MQQNEELKQAWDFVEHTGKSIFLTGKAGTGKTTFLRAIQSNSTKRMVVVAPTGVAAINAGGVTIHSFFQLPLSPFVPGVKMESRYDFSEEKRKIIRTLDLLIIDEISMVRSDLLDAIDAVLRRYRDHSRPFGGVQLLMIGDLQQLTPVVTPEDERLLADHYATPYFFGSKALSAIDYVTIELRHVYRQQDRTFIDLLNHIRDNQIGDNDLALLNSRYVADFHPAAEEGYIRLTTHNAKANNYNTQALKRLDKASFTYRAEIDRDFPESTFPTDEELELKVGAQVMFVRNDPSPAHLYYNGRIGHVVYLDEERVQVRCPGDDEEIDVERATWENTKYKINPHTKSIDSVVEGTFRQFPLRLAWAITIHKSQGLTFDRAIIDAQLSFASGQVYVALSRCKTLEGMVLSSPISRQAIIGDNRVDDYISRQAEAARQSIARLPALKDEYYRELLIDAFNFNELSTLENRLFRVLQEYCYKFPKAQQLHRILMKKLESDVVIVARKWTSFIAGRTIAQLHEEDFLERIGHSATYFAEHLAAIFDPLIDTTQGVTSDNKTGAKRLEQAFADLKLAYKARRYLLEEMTDEPFTTTGYLTHKQEAYLTAMDTKTKRRRKTKKSADKTAAEKAKAAKPDTRQVTLAMYRQGLNPDLIARERKLTLTTVYNHLTHFIASGELSADGLIDPSKLPVIENTLHKLPPQSPKAELKALCPPDISYTDINIALAIMAARKAGKP